MTARRDGTGSALESRLGHVFKKPHLLTRALTHSSYANQPGENTAHNEVLEFLGDAVLGAIASAWLFRRFPQATEGELTRMRSALVSRAALSRAAARIQIGSHL